MVSPRSESLRSVPLRSALGVAGLALLTATALTGCVQSATPGGSTSSTTATGATTPDGPESTASEPGGWQTTPGSSPTGTAPSSPNATGSQASPISEAQLPTEKDIAWHEFGDFTEEETGAGAGEPISDCFDLSDDLLGASQSIHRSFTAFDGSVPALAIGLQFGSEDEAKLAYQEFQNYRKGCVSHLADAGNPDGRVGDWVDVDTVAAQAGFFEFSYPTDGDEGRFESLGAVREGSRIILLLMYADGQDSNWAYQKNDDTGLALHPQIRSLPQVAQRLG